MCLKILKTLGGIDCLREGNSYKEKVHFMKWKNVEKLVVTIKMEVKVWDGD